MKRLCIIVLLSLALSLAGCSKDAEKSKEKAAPVAAPEPMLEPVREVAADFTTPEGLVTWMAARRNVPFTVKVFDLTQEGKQIKNIAWSVEASEDVQPQTAWATRDTKDVKPVFRIEFVQNVEGKLTADQAKMLFEKWSQTCSFELGVAGDGRTYVFTKGLPGMHLEAEDKGKALSRALELMTREVAGQTHRQVQEAKKTAKEKPTTESTENTERNE